MTQQQQETIQVVPKKKKNQSKAAKKKKKKTSGSGTNDDSIKNDKKKEDALPQKQQQTRDILTLTRNDERSCFDDDRTEAMDAPNNTTTNTPKTNKKKKKQKNTNNHPPTSNNFHGLATAKQHYRHGSTPTSESPPPASPPAVGPSAVAAPAAAASTTIAPSPYLLTSNRPGAYRIQVVRDNDDNDASSSFFSQDPPPSYAGTAAVEWWNNNNNSVSVDEPQQRQSPKTPSQSSLFGHPTTTTTTSVVIIIIAIFLMIVAAVVVVIVVVRVERNSSHGDSSNGSNNNNNTGSDINWSNTSIFASNSSNIDNLDNYPYPGGWGAILFGFGKIDLDLSDNAEGIVILNNDETVGHLKYRGDEATDISHLELLCDRKSSTAAECQFGFNTIVIESVVLIVACVSNTDGSGLVLESTLTNTSEVACNINQADSSASPTAYISHSVSVGQFCYGRSMEFEPAPQCLQGLDGETNIGRKTDTGNLDIPFCGQWNSCSSSSSSDNQCTIENAGGLSVSSPLEDTCIVTKPSGDDAVSYASLYNTSSMWYELQQKLVIPRFAINSHKVLISNNG
eukprot:CAMPEP_0168741586 /NCGR_PEP_ID=MMETSP0724-20121128/12595_1 /TAXON_ID=265536 /ORGANISM="Amphiprora sp., Strain CCMP467" /LENGTH=565 /DNA_ID=CAMNT_0008789105 /DNA_START=11 /DNA_END=1709 /DNA_ORIENTATION=+